MKQQRLENQRNGKFKGEWKTGRPKENISSLADQMRHKEKCI